MGRYKFPPRCSIPILKRLFEIADERNVTISVLCERMDVYPAQISDWRAGRNTPSIFNIMSLAAALGLELTLDGTL